MSNSKKAMRQAQKQAFAKHRSIKLTEFYCHHLIVDFLTQGKKI